MRTVQDIYTAYRINSGLQLHQLRVAGVAQLIVRAQSIPVDEQAVVHACLFHDMGNILKSDPPLFPSLFEPEGVEYWLRVKQEVEMKYGTDEHVATEAIVQEFGLLEASVQLIRGIRFSHIDEISRTGSREQQIVQYADMRVAPYGVVSLRERVEEGAKRYALRKGVGGEGIYNPFIYEESRVALERIETMLFEHIRPGDISNATVDPLVDALRTLHV